MMNRKALIGLLFLLTFPPISNAQTPIGYSYDAAGNRVKREIVLSRNSRRSQRLTDITETYTLSVFPNPTQGLVHIESQDLHDKECEITVHNAAGDQVCKTTMSQGSADIDLSQKDNGIYLTTVVAKGIKRTWKIVKK